MKLMYITILLGGLALFLAACAPSRQPPVTSQAETATAGSTASPSVSMAAATTPTAAATYQTISPAEAKERIDAGEKVILLDVRTAEEYAEGHIAGSVLLPMDELFVKAGQSLGDRDAVIFVYCRSGRRSKMAAEALLGRGYMQVYDLGGIIDWPYGTVK